MAKKTIYFDEDTQLEAWTAEGTGLTYIELSAPDCYEPRMIISLDSEDVGNLILDLQKLHAEMNGCEIVA